MVRVAKEIWYFSYLSLSSTLFKPLLKRLCRVKTSLKMLSLNQNKSSSRYRLAKLYGREQGYSVACMTDSQLERKKELCLQVAGGAAG